MAYGLVTTFEDPRFKEDRRCRLLPNDFAFPSEVQYSLPGKPVDEERVKAVSLKVKEWKAKRELYLPNFPAEKIAAIKNSLEYPDEGSPQFSQARA